MSRRLKALEAKLDARKRLGAYLLVENELRETGEKRTQEDIAEEVGVSYKTLWEWKTKDSVFIEYKNALADDFLAEKRAYVYGQLMKLIGGSQPSVKALDLYLRRFGLLTEKQVMVTEDAGGSRSNDDLAKELEELDDLLKDE
ncbi:MAG: phBC6A51 family helix-turn-helix protein [Bacillales bacterium]